jgi:hypothetical protein
LPLLWGVHPPLAAHLFRLRLARRVHPPLAAHLFRLRLARPLEARRNARRSSTLPLHPRRASRPACRTR